MVKLKELEDWLTPGEAAPHIGISRQALHKWLYDGRLRAVNTHAGWLIDPEDVTRLASEREAKKAQK